MSGGQLKILYAEGIACPACAAQVTAIGLPQQTGGCSRVSFDRTLCAVEGDGKELAKLWGVDEDYRTNAVPG